MITALRSPTLLVNIGTPPPTVMHDRYPAIIQENTINNIRKTLVFFLSYMQNYILFFNSIGIYLFLHRI